MNIRTHEKCPNDGEIMKVENFGKDGYELVCKKCRYKIKIMFPYGQVGLINGITAKE